MFASRPTGGAESPYERQVIIKPPSAGVRQREPGSGVRALEGTMKIQELIELFDKSMKDCDLYEIEIKREIREIIDDLKQNERSPEEVEKRQDEILNLNYKLDCARDVNDRIFDIYSDLVKRKRLTFGAYNAHCWLFDDSLLNSLNSVDAYTRAVEAIRCYKKNFEKTLIWKIALAPMYGLMYFLGYGPRRYFEEH